MNKISAQSIRFSRLFFRDATVILAFALFMGALATGGSPLSDELSYSSIASIVISVLLQAWATVKPKRK